MWSGTFGPYRIINIQQFLQSTAASQPCTSLTAAFTAVTWKAFVGHSDLELSPSQTHTDLYFGFPHRVKLLGNGMAQYNTTIQFRTQELSAFRRAITHDLRLVRSCILHLLCIWCALKQTVHKCLFLIGVPRLFSFFRPVTCDSSHLPKGWSAHRHRKWLAGHRRSAEVRQRW